MKYWITIIVASFFLVACETEAERDAMSRQEKAITDYLTQQLRDTTIALVTNNGAHRLILQSGVEPAVAFGDSISFSYIGYIFSGGSSKIIFDTNIDTFNFVPINNNGEGLMTSGKYIQGLENGLLGMKVGEKSQIIFPSSLGYGNNAVGLVPPLSALLFDVEMIKVKKQ